ncbi:50S ribosomal protein L21 [Flavobacteriaceae bacterium Ap0902]|nr:50S ribosomal protein L21 [Flavobacteriaceae bacterium Ap0902]
MYAIVEIAGHQYKVKKDQQLFVNRLEGKEGDSISFDKVLLTDNGTITVGAPVIEGAVVKAEILEHLKGDKVIVFKKKRRKGYMKKNGFRPFLTKIQITSLGDDDDSEKDSSKKETKSKAKKSDNQDKLTIIEGIGPKVQELLNENGINTFKDLSEQSPEDIKAILGPKGGIYSSMDPSTWPKQAEMAAEGKMDELKAWQDELDGGKK